MADTKSGLPEGTDTIIEGGGAGGSAGGPGRSGTASATNTTSTASNSTGARTGTTDSSEATDALITSSGTDSSSSGSGEGERQGVRGMISNAGSKLRDEGKTRARSFVSQGLERGSSTLSNLSSIVDDTAQQIADRLGPQYGDYARKTSQTLSRYADTLQNKDPEELVDDARELIRKSPGVALAGAAILGFGLVRLLKAGLEESQNGQGNRSSDRTGSTR